MKTNINLMFMLAIGVSAKSTEVLQYFPKSCNKSVTHLSSKQTFRVVLSTNTSEENGRIERCLLQFVLEKDKYYVHGKKNDMVVKLEDDNLNSNDMDIDILSGPPSENEPLTTLNSGVHSSWRGRIPLNKLFLQYRLKDTNGSIFDTVVEKNLSVSLWYKKCQYCYRENTGFNYSGKKNSFESFCSETVCIGNEIRRFNNEWSLGCTKCRSIEFEVKESVQFCVQTYRPLYMLEPDSKYTYNCHVSVDIDNHRVMTLNDAISKYYCIPWEVVGRKVKFIFGVNDSWLCEDASVTRRCSVWIKTNATQRYSYVCPPRITTTTTRDWRDNWSSWSSWSGSNDYDYEDPETDMTTVYMIAGIGCTLTCICGSVCKLVSVGKRSNRDRNNFQQSETYRLRTLRGETRSQSAEPLQVSDERTNIPSTTSTWRNHENPRLTLTLSMTDEAETGAVSQEGNTSRILSDPPPSYDEVCKNHHNYIK